MSSSKLGIVREHISPDLLFSAFNFAQMSSEIEAIVEPPEKLLLQKHQSFIISTLLSSVAFMEASINELYYVASDEVLEIGRMPVEYRNRLSAMWRVEKFSKSARILEKYQIALKLLGKEEFKKGYDPYQSAQLLIDLRNALVHYVPVTTVIRLDHNKVGNSELEKKLKNKFKTNPFVPKFPVFPANQPERRFDYPFFPGRCLGYGCAKWASERSLSFVNEFFTRLNLKWYYHQVIPELPSLK